MRSLAVFAGGCDLEAVETVCAGDLDVLESLVQKSLVLQRPGVGGSARFLMLATVREYADELLTAAGEEAEARARHADHVLALVERAEPRVARCAGNWSGWRGWSRRSATSGRPSTGCSHREGASQALRIVSTLIDFWDVRGSHQEARGWLERGLAALPGSRRPDPGSRAARGRLGRLPGRRPRPGPRRSRPSRWRSRRRPGDVHLETRALSQLAGVAMLEGAFAETVAPGRRRRRVRQASGRRRRCSPSR